MAVHFQYPELRPVALEAEKRAIRTSRIRNIRYRPQTKNVGEMLAPPGSVTVFLAKKGSKILKEIEEALAGNGKEAELVRRLVKTFTSRKRMSVEEATKLLSKERVFADIRHGGTTVAASLFHPEGLDCCVVVLPYNGGRMVRGGLTLVERYQYKPHPDDPGTGPFPGDPIPIPEPGPGPDPSPELVAIAVVHPPALTRAEREALARVPASQLELNLGKASDCTAVTGIAVAAVVVLLVVAIMTAGCAAFEIKALTEQEIRAMGPMATAQKILQARRAAIEQIGVR